MASPRLDRCRHRNNISVTLAYVRIGSSGATINLEAKDMPKFEHRTRYLPPANLSAAEFKAIEDALGNEFNGVTQWTFWSGNTTISDMSLDDLLDELKEVAGLSDFEINGDIGDASLTITAGEDGCILEFDTSHALSGKMAARARAIEGIFRDNKRRSAYIPRPVASIPGIKKLALSPAIHVGKRRFRLQIAWDEVATKVITNWLSYIGTAGLSFLLGVAVGRVLPF
jgi:hypothetical protein